jgi:hypothetical protein
LIFLNKRCRLLNKVTGSARHFHYSQHTSQGYGLLRVRTYILWNLEMRMYAMVHNRWLWYHGYIHGKDKMLLSKVRLWWWEVLEGALF